MTRTVGHNQTFTIVVIGDCCHPQWNVLWSAFDQADCVFSGPTLRTARNLVMAGLYPDLLVLFEDHVHQFAEGDWLSFLACSPLTRTVIVFTDWCESEPRSGSPLPGVIRMHWLRWMTLGKSLIASLRQQSIDSWSLPPTASEEDRLLADLCQVTSRPNQARFKRIGVVTSSRESFAWIKQVAASMADCVFWIREGHTHIQTDSSPDLLIIDGFEEAVTVQRLITTLRRGVWSGVSPVTPCVVLLNFPRWDTVDALLRLGNVRVLPKPSLLTDLEQVVADLGYSKC